MKRVLLLLSFLFAISASFATAQTVGDDYFLPVDSNGKVFITGVVEVSFSADTIIGLTKGFEEEVGHWKNFDTGDKYFEMSKISFITEIGVGVKYVDVPFVGLIEKPQSIVKRLLTLEVKDGKHRYTLSDFETERWQIRGDVPSSGPSNEMHRQRAACIKGYRNKVHGITREEYLDEEEKSLPAEYEAVMAFVKVVENMCNKYSEF